MTFLRWLIDDISDVPRFFKKTITVENAFPLLITVGKNNGSSFFLKKCGTSEMSSMGHRT